MMQAGQQIGGKYRLLHPLGVGGMGMVWSAEHETLKQTVALKLLRGQATRSVIKRFQREAQIAASIRHRNIIYISDFGVTDDGPYLVMELLHGVPLSERLYVGEPLGLPAFLTLMDEALQGLAAVHAAGIVHRDLKPANIFLVRESDGRVHPKLLDFGISRSMERDQGHTITIEGMVMGTPEYLSPEHARGRVGDHRSDLYSLGVLMYEALSGCLPFRADNTADLLVALLNQAPIPLHAMRPALGMPLSNVVMRALDRDPERRYQSTAELRAALAACADESLAKLSLPERVPVSRPPPIMVSSAPPPAAPPPAALPKPELPATLSTAAMPAVPSRRRWLLLAAGAAAAGALGLSLAMRAASAGAPVQAPRELRVVPAAVPDASAPEPASHLEPVEDPPAAKPDVPTRPTAKPAHAPRPGAKPGKRALLRNPGF